MMDAIVTKESLSKMLTNENQQYVGNVVGRALVAIFQRQTEVEKSSNQTVQNNGVGFTGADAHSGTIIAKYYLKHKKLEDWQIEKWIKSDKNGSPRIAKYHAQLNEVAISKRA
jgi:hypothetical protein